MKHNQLAIAVGDDQNERGANQNRYRELSPKVFAFVGGFSADIVRMRQDGVELVFLMATTAQNAARIATGYRCDGRYFRTGS